MKIKAFLKAIFIGDTTFVEPPALCSPADYQSEIAKLQEDLRLARCAHRAYARRISAFALDHPAMHGLYFTRAGDHQRKESASATA
jgi:hypothetical protein